MRMRAENPCLAQAPGSGLHPVIARLLRNRGVSEADAQSFLDPCWARSADPLRIPGMETAAARLKAAAKRGEGVFICGDSDVDGLTSSVIVYEALRLLGAEAQARPTNRIAEGYGFSEAMLGRALASGARVLVLTDCGTNQPDAVRRLAEAGIDTVILDHHQPENPAFDAILVNPHCFDHAPLRELCSAGLAFKLAQALLPWEAARGFADLAAVGTLADYAPLLGENRILVREGLKELAQTRRPGLKRLCAEMGLGEPSAEKVLRLLVPRLNAAGRLGDAAPVWHLLRSDEQAACGEWAGIAEAAHERTRALQKRIMSEAMAQAERLHFRDRHVVVVARQGWHPGLMGPLASLLANRYQRPAVAIALSGAEGVGSVRSIAAVNMLSVLERCREVLTRFGGHAQACGLTVAADRLSAFKEMVNHHARGPLAAMPCREETAADVEISLDELDPEWVGVLRDFEPYGPGNPPPAVLLRGVRCEWKSPRRAWIVDGEKRWLLKGAVPRETPLLYDVAATPALEKERITLALASIRESGGAP